MNNNNKCMYEMKTELVSKVDYEHKRDYYYNSKKDDSARKHMELNYSNFNGFEIKIEVWIESLYNKKRTGVIGIFKGKSITHYALGLPTINGSYLDPETILGKQFMPLIDKFIYKVAIAVTGKCENCSHAYPEHELRMVYNQILCYDCEPDYKSMLQYDMEHVEKDFVCWFNQDPETGEYYKDLIVHAIWKSGSVGIPHWEFKIEEGDRDDLTDSMKDSIISVLDGL